MGLPIGWCPGCRSRPGSTRETGGADEYDHAPRGTSNARPQRRPSGITPCSLAGYRLFTTHTGDPHSAAADGAANLSSLAGAGCGTDGDLHLDLEWALVDLR